ncbi:NAD(P)/FAD-dependent oxidoreductase [Chloroflexota bacterium]
MDRRYEIVIIGGGPAGLSAGLYVGRARRRTLLIERVLVGGQMVNAELIENYPGFPGGISGFELGQLMEQQVRQYGVEVEMGDVPAIELRGREKVVRMSDGIYLAKALIIAGGCSHNKLGVPGEGKLSGRGVSYCATCDAALYRGEVVAVVGGGDTAITDALLLTRFARRVVVIHRRRELRASRVLQERAFASPGLEFVWDSVVESIEGDSQVKELRLCDVNSGERSSLPVGGVFVSVGLRPVTDYLDGLLTLAPGGYIVVNERLETEVGGIFAAGDIRLNSGRQIVTAAGDGATAALSAERYLSEQS